MSSQPVLQESREFTKWHHAICVALAVAALACAAHYQLVSVNTLVCTSPIHGVPWINLAAILVSLSASISILHFLLPFLVNFATTLLICLFTAYVAFMCVMGIMGPPDTREQVLQLVNTLVQSPVKWLNPQPSRWMF